MQRRASARVRHFGILLVMRLVDLSELAGALDVHRGECISLVGGGGKTTSLFTLGEQLPGTTVLTTTTKMGSEQRNGLTTLVDPCDDDVRKALELHGRVLVWKNADQRRATGVSAERCDRWMMIADNVVVEADGSRKRPFKAPAEYEPVIPSATTLLVACIGASALGKPIAQACHRPERVATLLDCSTSDVLTPQRAARVLCHDNGSKKNLPDTSRFAVVAHRVNDETRQAIEQLAHSLGDTPFVAVRERR